MGRRTQGNSTQSFRFPVSDWRFEQDLDTHYMVPKALPPTQVKIKASQARDL